MSVAEEYTKEELSFGKWLFSGECDFKIGATKWEHIPMSPIPEIAFVGLSNVGKSSLLNALTGRNSLARTSNTPGRTKQLNFFLLRNHLMLVDLPGYGYARASKKEIDAWNKLILDYLQSRQNLARVCFLIDARRQIKKTDVEMMKILDAAAISYQIILTKCDKAAKKDIEALEKNIKKDAYKYTALYPQILTTSSAKKQGIEHLRAELGRFTIDKQ